MQFILISMCILGAKVRYNATDSSCADDRIQRWSNEGRLIAVCPEVMAGLPTPRPATEIQAGDGNSVLTGKSTIIDKDKFDYTDAYLRGANIALELVEKHKIRMAILKDGSPSCGRTFIYDGSFSGETKQGIGATTALLEKHGVKVFSETQLDQAEQYLLSIEQSEN